MRCTFDSTILARRGIQEGQRMFRRFEKSRVKVKTVPPPLLSLLIQDISGAMQLSKENLRKPFSKLEVFLRATMAAWRKSPGPEAVGRTKGYFQAHCSHISGIENAFLCMSFIIDRGMYVGHILSYLHSRLQPLKH